MGRFILVSLGLLVMALSITGEFQLGLSCLERPNLLHPPPPPPSPALLAIFSLGSLSSRTGAKKPCLKGWYLRNQQCNKLFEEQKNWNDAKVRSACMPVNLLAQAEEKT